MRKPSSLPNPHSSLHTMRAFHILLFFSLLLLVGACTQDLPDNPGHTDKKRVTFSLALTPAATESASRAAWTPVLGAEKELVMNGFCVMVNAETKKVEQVFTSRDKDPKGQKYCNVYNDAGSREIETSTGEKLFYTFANLSREKVEQAIAASMNQPGFHFTEDAVLDTVKIHQATIAISGNGFQPSLPNGIGIPMSGHQHLTIAASDQGKEIQLNVVRMLAKLEFEISNDTKTPLYVDSIVFENITKNSPDDDTPNLFLFPAPRTPKEYDQTMITIKPNLTEWGKTNYEKQRISVKQTLEVGAKTNVVYYLNETAAPNTKFGDFMLTLNLRENDATGIKQQRFALISNAETAYQDSWLYIARNDWRYIPIHLHDYLFELIPQDFPPIGVLPSSVKEADGTFTCTFHADGDFHLQPRITDRKTGKEVTGWTASDPKWQTITPNPGLYTASGTPAWYKPGSYIHGSFAPNATGQSTHVLTLTAAPEGVTARRFVCPVIIERK